MRELDGMEGLKKSDDAGLVQCWFYYYFFNLSVSK